MTRDFVKSCVVDAADDFSATLPVLCSRLAHTPFPEPAEELRLQLLELLDSFLKRDECAARAGAYLSDLAELCRCASGDAFPDSKKQTGVIVQRLCKAHRDQMHLYLEPLLQATLPNLGHQHSRVRLGAIRAVGSLMRCPASETERLFKETVFPAVAVLAGDRTGSVRKARVEVVARWIEGLPSIAGGAATATATALEGPLVAELFAGMADEAPEVQQLAWERLQAVAAARTAQRAAAEADRAGTEATAGATAEVAADLAVAAEHAAGDMAAEARTDAVMQDLAARGQLRADSGAGRAAVAAAGTGGGGGGEGAFDSDPGVTEFVAPLKERPSAVVRAFARRHLDAVLGVFLQLLTDWTVPKRLRAARSLQRVLAVVERGVVPAAPRVLAALCRAAHEDDRDVAPEVARLGEAVGTYLPPESFVPRLLEQARGETQGLEQSLHREQALAVLAAAVRGMAGAAGLGPHLQPLAEALATPALCETEDPGLQSRAAQTAAHLVDTADALRKTGDRLEDGLVVPLLHALLQLSAHAPAHAAALRSALQRLAVAAGCTPQTPAPEPGRPWHPDPVGQGAVCELVSRHAGLLLAQATASEPAWTATHPGLRLWDATVREGLTAMGPHTGDLIAVFAAALRPERAPEVRVSVLALLDTVLSCTALHPALRAHGSTLVSAIVIPNAVWRVGRVPSTIRKVTMACANTACEAGVIDGAALRATFADLQPVLVSCLEDDDWVTRRLTCLTLTGIFASLRAQLSDFEVSKLYGELLKRLDDSSDAVRLACCGMLRTFFSCGPREAYQSTILDYTMDCLLIHLDDPDRTIQDAVQGTIEAAIPLNPEVVERKCRQARGQQRSPLRCDEVVAKCSAPHAVEDVQVSVAGGMDIE